MTRKKKIVEMSVIPKSREQRWIWRSEGGIINIVVIINLVISFEH